MRLNRFLALCGLGSRRACEDLIRSGRVAINGRDVTDLATRVGPDDAVRVDGERVRPPESTTTLVLNKPAGCLSTRDDETGRHRQTVYDLLPPHLRTLHYVGRLDLDSQGLILFTNSGELTEKLTHPRHGIEKEYVVTLDRPFDLAAHRAQLITGFPIEGGFARAVDVCVHTPRVVGLVLTQGIKRQIRLMFDHLGYQVRKLERVRIGGLTVPGLKPGRWRLLTAAEIEKILERRPTARH